MNTISTESTKVANEAIVLGAAESENAEATLAGAQTTKIIGEPSVRVTETAFDALLDRVMLEYQQTHEELNLSMLSAAVDSVLAKTNLTSQYQQELLAKSVQLVMELTRLDKELQSANDEVKAAQKAVTAAEEALAAAKKADPLQDLSAYEQAVKDAKGALTAAEEKATGLDEQIATTTTELENTLAKLDDSSKRVLAAAVRLVATSDMSYLETLRNFRKEQSSDELPSLEAFAQLLSGENINDILMQELGIKA